MRRTGISALIVGALAAQLLIPAVVGGSALPAAHADPYTPPYPTVAAVGSPTTDPLLSALSDRITIRDMPVLGSYSAVGTTPVQIKAGYSCSIARPATDQAGLNALIASVTNYDKCVDIARTTAALPLTGGPQIAYVPFAEDDLTFAETSSSTVTRTLTAAQVKSIYTCAVTGVTPRIPGPGSGVRARWLGYLGISEADLTAGKYPCIVDHSSSGVAQAENDGRVLDNNSIMPMSVAGYLSQRAGQQPDFTGSARLGTIADTGSTQPVVANAAQYPGGVSFAIAGNSTLPTGISTTLLNAIYTCKKTGYTPLLPAAGNTRIAFETLLGIADSDVTANKYPCISTTVNGQPIAEDDGRVLTTATSIMPFTTAGWANQLSGASVDLLGNARLGWLAPSVGSPTGHAPLPLTPNPAYPAPLRYAVYNAIPVTSIDQDPINELLIGPKSKVCRNSALIADYGFLPIAPGEPEPCGSWQHITGGPATATVRSNATPGTATTATTTTRANYTPQIALDSGLLPGSGASVYAAHGGCTMSGTMSNVQTGNNAGYQIKAVVDGPKCTLTVSGAYIVASTGATVQATPFTQTVTGHTVVTVPNLIPAALQLQHSSSADYYTGDVMSSMSYSLTDPAAALPAARVSINTGFDFSGITGITASSHITPDLTVRDVYLRWNPVPNAVKYNIYRADLTTGDPAYHSIGYAPQPASLYLTLGEYWDSAITALHDYWYIVAPVYSDGSYGSQSLPIRQVPGVPNRIKHYIALGDSYAAGNGSSQDTGGNCHRSYNSYAGLIKDIEDPNPLSYYTSQIDGDQYQGMVDLFACAGAKTTNIIDSLPGSQVQPGMDDSEPLWPIFGKGIPVDFQANLYQEAAERMPPDLVSLSIGGNDVGFASVLQDCALGNNGCTTGSSLTAYEANIRARIDAVASNLAQVYDTLGQQIAGDAPLYVIGYPHLFPADGGTTNCAVAPIANWVTGLSPERMLMLNRLTDYLDNTIQQTVENERTNVGYTELFFLDTRSAYAGHDICAGDNAWINRIQVEFTGDGFGAVPGSAHPNDGGWAATAQLLATAAGIGPGSG